MEGLCTILYDTLRPYIIRIDHLETLAEICSILKVEMLDEHVSYSRKCTVSSLLECIFRYKISFLSVP